MDGTAVKEIAALEDKAKTIEIGGKMFARGDYKPIIHDPRADSIDGSTLTGLVDYILENRDGLEYEKLTLQVVDYSEVRLFGIPTGPNLNRTTHFIAKLDSELPRFSFDNFMETEDFIIKLNSLFEPTEDRARVIAIASKVVATDFIAGEDDGLGQKVNIQRGVSGGVTDNVTTKGWYTLAPYRTFRDIEQPKSAFILRLRENNGKVPRVALFDAEGGIWRNTAIGLIKEYLAAKLVTPEGVKIGIPIIA